jgi:hypothetical protein
VRPRLFSRTAQSSAEWAGERGGINIRSGLSGRRDRGQRKKDNEGSFHEAFWPEFVLDGSKGGVS